MLQYTRSQPNEIMQRAFIEGFHKKQFVAQIFETAQNFENKVFFEYPQSIWTTASIGWGGRESSGSILPKPRKRA